MDRGELHVFGDDPDDEILPALLSTAAMLPVYPPREVNGYRYADGGILASLPIQVAVARGADEIIALNLTTQLKPPDDRDSALDMMLHTIDLLLHAQVELTRAYVEHKAEIPVHIIDLEPEEYTGLLDLDEMDRLIDRGRELTEQALEEIDIGDH
jgi:NTE family protein